MSMGPIAGLGGGLSVGAGGDCICSRFPLLYPPSPCCTSNGNGNGDTGECDPSVLPAGSGGDGASCTCSDGSGSTISIATSGASGFTVCEAGLYGGSQARGPRLTGNLRNGAQMATLGTSGTAPCSSPVGTTPVAVPTVGASFSQAVGTFSGAGIIRWLPITCLETGVTLSLTCCASVTFYHPTGGTKHYSTPGGTGLSCESMPTPEQYSSGTGQGVPNAAVTVTVTQLP